VLFTEPTLPFILVPMLLGIYCGATNRLKNWTFHAIFCVVDGYCGDASAQKRPVEAALYVLVCPQLIAGPIVRHRQIWMRSWRSFLRCSRW
jgi:hypothetical protein